ncbi:hypothetical protein CNMCM5793_003472 [Aspergillus hiratsukae]|uniref:Uncharacterized protein n=1 Tax=Aspergillus hiratsukae TaxID=1194566 RepID=A0A8H6P2P1_9EURO|nr:hypothetical protein CNMCM5793_003472 [Aspergillus hiratsukae]KAF7170563.1 hypothetical protein CNMCM6106_005187 [Aspergillus hiratsukae]
MDNFATLPMAAYLLPDESDPDDEDFHAPETCPRRDPIESDAVVSIPSTPSSTDLLDLDLEIITPPGYHERHSENREPRLRDGDSSNADVQVQLDRMGSLHPEADQDGRLRRTTPSPNREAQRSSLAAGKSRLARGIERSVEEVEILHTVVEEIK